MSSVASATALVALLAVAAAAAEMRTLPGGRYSPFFPVKGELPIDVAPFDLDLRPVTNGEYLEFVRALPSWRRSRVPRLEADEAYLSHWAGDLELGTDADPLQPVTFVSWFAASAFCASVGKRLPMEAEWELAANPPSESAEAKAESERRILAFYGRPRGELPHAGDTPPNAYGIRDLHGVVWEWLADWNASVLPSDSRRDSGADTSPFCGGGAAAAAEPESYTTFMRFAFRSSVEPRFALHHLGFRCARSAS